MNTLPRKLVGKLVSIDVVYRVVRMVAMYCNECSNSG